MKLGLCLMGIREQKSSSLKAIIFMNVDSRRKGFILCKQKVKAYHLYSKGHVYLIHDHVSTNTMTSFITVMFGILNKTKFIKRKLLHKVTKLI